MTEKPSGLSTADLARAQRGRGGVFTCRVDRLKCLQNGTSKHFQNLLTAL